jgi:hypothetical protein
MSCVKIKIVKNIYNHFFTRVTACPQKYNKLYKRLLLFLQSRHVPPHRLISICTKPRKSFSRQFFALDKPSGIDNIYIGLD